jgi:cellulose synthase/poly-beta-1,6-N-acetylglucosamine synthase-like glycosyltransferase
LGWACTAALLPISLLAVYQWVLAVASVLPSRARKSARKGERTSFLILVPAHNEEAGLAATLRSFEKVDYPNGRVRIVVVADRCDDGTARLARSCGADCLERRDGPPGKGAAIAWAIDELHKSGAEFGGLVIVDADTVVDPNLLGAFEEGLCSGHEVQQGYNYLSNPWESPFTRIIAVTSVLRNGFFYSGKARLGLSAMLSGCGMCFSRRIIDRHRWTAFSIGEDWEFSVSLLLDGERIYFNPVARVAARESCGFKQASSQRLRWASGRHGVAAASTMSLFKAGLRLRRLDLWDAALTIFAPTYSAQATLTVLCLVTGWYLSNEPSWRFLFPWATVTIGLLAAYFALGVALTEAPERALVGILLIPAFLPWRMAIEILGLLGYGRKRWVRTSRLSEDYRESASAQAE